MKKMLVSVSGGKTSAFMAGWLWKNKRKEFDLSFAFANTGLEDEKTLEFVDKLSDHFGFHIFWVEANVFHGERKGTTYTITSPEIASRNGEPFEQIIKKYGIPNKMFPHCTRELKQRPLNAWGKEHLGKDFYTAIGIRIDEADRINSKAREMKFIYPLISMIPMTKIQINEYWDSMPFNLDLPEYRGNCKTCWKKSDKKLFRIAQETPEDFEFMKRMEILYGMKGKKGAPDKPITFFRGNRSSFDILKGTKGPNEFINDDLVGGDSCEVYSSCGD